jgi:inhibitor of KinA sporulation pathway (predicted exonuclease)
MKYDKLLVVDLEATCWETKEESIKNTSEIIEVGVVLLNMRSGKIEKSQGIIVKPTESKISPFCTSLTTLTQEQVDTEGVSFAKAYDILMDEYDSANTPWVSYGDYDRKMFERQCARYSCQTPMSNIHFNVKALMAVLHHSHKAVGMDRALKALNIPLVGTHHRGIDDALNIAKIFQLITIKG